MYFHARLLSNMGVKEGFDPRIKIAQCRVWRNEEIEVTKKEENFWLNKKCFFLF